MKKYLSLAGLVAFLCLASFGSGTFLAQYNLKKSFKTIYTKEKVPEEPQKTEAAIPEETKNETPESSPEEIPKAEVEKVTFGILGDTQYFKGVGGTLPGAKNFFEKSNVDLVFAVGDLVSGCDNVSECKGKYATWKASMGKLAAKTYAMQGNHDRTGKDKADEAWLASFNFPKNGPAGFQGFSYSFDINNSHFVVLDSEKPKENLVNDVQRNWLEQDLNRNKKENTFVFFHEPAYPVSSKIGESLDVNGKERDALWGIISSHKVTAVFSGHEHIFSRKKINGVYQFVVGNTDSFNHDAPKAGMAEYSYVGSHYALVSVEGKSVNIKVYAASGKEINSFDFSGKP